MAKVINSLVINVIMLHHTSFAWHSTNWTNTKAYLIHVISASILHPPNQDWELTLNANMREYDIRAISAVLLSPWRQTWIGIKSRNISTVLYCREYWKHLTDSMAGSKCKCLLYLHIKLNPDFPSPLPKSSELTVLFLLQPLTFFFWSSEVTRERFEIILV